MKPYSQKCMKIYMTITLYCSFLASGLSIAVTGPCLLQLQELVQTDTEKIGFVFTARSIGALIGSIAGGILLDATKYKHVLLTIFNFFIGTSVLAIPWSRNLGTLTGFMVVNGMSLGALLTGVNVVGLSLWKTQTGPFYQTLHFIYGVGAILAPLIAIPFLDDFLEDLHVDIDNTTAFNNTDELMNNSSDSTTVISSNIVWPFSIIGAFAQLVTLMFLAICLISPTEKQPRQKNRSVDSKAGFGFVFVVVFINVLLVLFSQGVEVGYAQMLTTYVVKGGLHLPTSTGSLMTSIFWTAYTLSKLGQIFVAIKVSSFHLVVFDTVVCLLGSFILLIFGSNEWAVWLATVFLGVGVASSFPAMVGWLDTYLNVTNKIFSTFIVAGATGEMLIPFLISYFINTVPEILTFVILTLCIFVSVIVVVLHLILRRREKCNEDPTKSRKADSSNVIAEMERL